MKSMSHAISRAFVGAAMVVATSHAAAEVTLPTTLLDANATLTFSTAAQQVLSFVHISTSALGTTTAVSGTPGAYNLPITSVTGNIDLFSSTLFVPSQGVSAGAGLLLMNDKTYGGLGLANFSIDFTKNVVYGDVFVKGGSVIKNTAIFNFDVTSPLDLDVSLLPLSVDLDVTLGNLKLTTSAATTFASALNVSAAFVDALTEMDYGTISANIHSGLRLFDAPSGKALTKVNFPVPEPSTYVLIAMGMATAGWMASRRRAG
ncbi:MAG: PEP-CTERM sorting domain-containing protein [Aquabacterium sp.]|jgi:hypothetical protein|nr:MAG: PEP-CTERM sorting domain-containing protein [Aquabacterium sp.]TAL24236.1 MAG: PEP-CTERM sorting domain-containing protein [Aquabacterium sp.]